MKVLITDKMAEEAIQVIKQAGHEVTYDEMDHDTLLKEIPKYDALMVRSRTKAITEIVEAGAKGNLKVIGRAGIGVDNIEYTFLDNDYNSSFAGVLSTEPLLKELNFMPGENQLRELTTRLFIPFGTSTGSYSGSLSLVGLGS